MNTLRTFLIFLFLAAALQGPAQADYPYSADIRKFRDMDLVAMPPSDAILFAGSSSFTMWTDVQAYFPGYAIINRGFGGSTLLDQIHYAEDIYKPYFPCQIIIYCGENDLAYNDTVTGMTVEKRFEELFGIIRGYSPKAKITYVSMKPSPSRWHLSGKMQEGNTAIKEFLAGQPNTSFVDVWDRMLNGQGEPDAALFLDDMLHMNPRGYAIWQEAIQPELIKK